MEIFEAREVTEELVEAFRRLMPQLSPTYTAPSRRELQDLIDSPSVILLMARDGGQIAGTLSLAFFRVPSGMHAWIEDVVVDQAARGQGIGEALTRAALQRAKELGVQTVNLTSRPSREAANRLYLRVGFERRQTNLYRYWITPE